MMPNSQEKNSFLCPCSSQKSYRECCKKYHDGALPENALLLMRSRYSAYALQLAEYIIKTTHPDNPSYSTNSQMWKREILQFTSSTQFEGLKIIEFIDGHDKATVVFTAYLRQGRDGSSHNATFTEKSIFVKIGEEWLYKSGTLSSITNKKY